ncbi:MAG: hypothetical protein NC937_00950 [Candidatus Omnitrophica bacterium]|nr:hypothetical protein [Candidatus Omnitrophota bacterium]MCM8824710.1 hypothetical protein [Candidatus Omnitrophota bacterium]
MKVTSINRFKDSKLKSCVIGIGKFDGFHKGHQKIITEIVKMSKKYNCIPAIFTIKNYPAASNISSWKERLNAFKKNGIELCLWAEFAAIMKVSHHEFLKMLSSLCKIKAIVVGKNFKFGFHRKGDVNFLKSWATQKKVTVKLLKPVIINGRTVSSSIIKNMIRSSKFYEAAKMLGRWYSLKGVCIHGRAEGRNIGIPTINLQLENRNNPLSEGVYACMVKQRKRFHKAVFFYGKPRTFSNTETSFEIHIPETEIGNSYGRTFEVIPVKKIRNPEKFDSIEALANVIKNDIAKMNKIFAKEFDGIEKKV